jgi:uncharacterized membrane protein YkvA (DUF1232 family)
MGRLAEWAHALKRESLALYYAARDPRTPWYAKVVAGAVVAYALSPIDLIPDFIPVLGYLDDLLLLPLGIWLALGLVPAPVLADARRRAEATLERPTSRTAAVVIVAIWVVGAIALGTWLLQFL